MVAITDTNCNPDDIDYPIPANDDAIRTIKLVCARIADAVLEGKSDTAAPPTEVSLEEAEAAKIEEPLIFTPDEE